MPWNPIPKFPLVIKNLQERGYVLEFTTNELENSMMLILGVTRKPTLDRTREIMRRLGYIDEVHNGIYKKGLRG